jgi:hypothetical protein
MHAAVIIASIGNIANFARVAQLRAYCGWAPHVSQSGTSLRHVRLTSGGQRHLKQILYLAVWNATRQTECEWAKLYHRLVPIKCRYNEMTRQYTGRATVMGRIAGQMISTIFVLLKQDAELLSRLPHGVQPPQPACYDPEIHRQHRSGHYRPFSLGTSATMLELSHH